ncbi:hypothetical protein [Brevibacterium litoralis]|uniref:hypothetical protein n=1 Tax=Brevibacterium litoralis TaxID=3138935 RepID=UPI0032ECFB63
MKKPRGKDSFSMLYRIGHKVELVLLSVMGPSTYPAATDPRERSKREYARRKELHEAWKAQQE